MWFVYISENEEKIMKSGIYFNVNWIRYVKVFSFLGIGCHCGDLEAFDASRFGTRLRHLWTCLSSIKHLYTFFNGHILYPIHGVSLSFFLCLEEKKKKVCGPILVLKHYAYIYSTPFIPLLYLNLWELWCWFDWSWLLTLQVPAP